jgi:endo-1,4-beta-xylanase
MRNQVNRVVTCTLAVLAVSSLLAFRPAAIRATSAIMGYHDPSEVAGIMRGWACDPGQPDASLDVSFQADGQTIGSTVANVEREAAVGSLCGTRNHGFLFNVPNSIPDGAVIEAYTTEGHVRLEGPGIIYAKVLPDREPLGYQDPSTTLGQMRGWTCDPADSGRVVRVDFYEGAADFHGTYLGAAFASQVREDPVATMCGSAAHGYTFTLPERLRDGQAHQIYAYGISPGETANMLLIGSPRLAPMESLSGDRRAVTYGSFINYAEVLQDPSLAQLVQAHDQMILPEGMGSWSQESQYGSTPETDAAIAFGQQHGIRVKGYLLDLTKPMDDPAPSWYGPGMSHDELMNLFHAYVRDVVGRYAGQVVQYRVANEAFRPDGSLKNDLSGQTLDLDTMFRWVHEMDPQATLLLEDFGAEEVNAKSDGIYRWLLSARARGVPVDGFAFQGHMRLGSSLDEGSLVRNMTRLSALHLETDFSEVDVAIGARPGSADKWARQADIYSLMVDACYRFPSCTTFLTFGLSDVDSWITTRQGGWDAEFPFDLAYQPKPAWLALQAALRLP